MIYETIQEVGKNLRENAQFYIGMAYGVIGTLSGIGIWVCKRGIRKCKEIQADCSEIQRKLPSPLEDL